MILICFLQYACDPLSIKFKSNLENFKLITITLRLIYHSLNRNFKCIINLVLPI